jgi:hypothetical protein
LNIEYLGPRFALSQWEILRESPWLAVMQVGYVLWGAWKAQAELMDADFHQSISTTSASFAWSERVLLERFALSKGRTQA